MRFKGKSALVCGAGGGIGLATARGLLSAGLNVALAEDVPVVGGRIDMGTYRWEPELDELLWKPSSAWDD